MKAAVNVLLPSILLATLVFTGCKTTVLPPPPTTATVDLFNGHNFDGWTFRMRNHANPMKTWSVSDGIIHCTGQPLGYARTRSQYRDYTLTCVWRFVKLSPDPRANDSGIFVHLQPPDVVFPECVQCQGLYQHQGDLILERGANADGYQVGKDTVTIPQMGPPNENPPGQWNTNQVVCQGNTIALFVNGKPMNQITGCNLSSGYLGIQSEGGDIEIRKFTLQPLQ